MKIFSSYFWHDTKYQISAWFNPRQKWLTKTIPNIWCDKVTLIPNLMFTCLIHYVEDEKGLQDEIDWSKDLKDDWVSQEYIDSIKARDILLREVYNYVKTERPMLEKQHDNSYPTTDDFFIKNEDGHYTVKRCEELYGVPFEEAYAETNRLEKLIEEKNLWAMNAIVKYHQHLWT